MRISFVIPYFAPAWAYGGPPRIAYDLARQLVKYGHSVDVLTTDALDETHRLPVGSAHLDGIRVWRVANVSNRLAWNHKIFLPLGFSRAVAHVLGATDVVHLFDFRTYQNALALTKLGRTTIPYVVSALGELPRAFGLKRPVKRLYDEVFGRKMLRGAACLLAQTADEAAWYRRFGAGPDRIRILPLAVDLDAIVPVQPRGTFRASLGISPSEHLVLFLGRIHEYKGLETLVRAFARVRERQANIRLVIAGRDDGYLPTVKELARQLAPAGSILFPGPVYGADRFAAYADADLFAITPSHAEQTSLAALEACACQTPALVTSTAPIPGLDEARAGLTVAPEETAVASALRRLLRDREELERMGVRANGLVRSCFSLDGVSHSLERIYAEAIRHGVQATPRRCDG